MKEKMKLYSVEMTETELRLFSEFLGQKEFDESFYHYGYKGSIEDFDERTRKKLVDESKDRGERYGNEEIERFDYRHPYTTAAGIKKTSENYEDKNLPVDAQIVLGRYRQSSEYVPEVTKDKEDYLKNVSDGKHRMSRKFVIEKDKIAGKLLDDQRELNTREKYDNNLANQANRERNKALIESRHLKKEDPETFNRIKNNVDFEAETARDRAIRSRDAALNHWYRSRGARDKLDSIAYESSDIINKESDLAKSKYDDKYSSKRVEKWLDKKIDADKAKNIVDRRHSNDSKYQERDTEKGRNRDNFHISDINRKWEDTGIVYNEATGRSLNKDAAIAAGVTAGLGAGAYALHKHLKNKKKEKELVKDKYKTDSDKKKEDKKK